MKSTPQQQRSRDTVDRLLAAANEEFAIHGVGGATTTSIAERAGVSVGSLYRFFGDKEALAAALADRYLDAAVDAFGPLIAAIESVDDVVPTIRALVRTAAELQRSHAGYYRITQESAPDMADSPASGVRSTLVEYFAAELDRLGVGESPAARRRVVSMITETLRHTLAINPPGSADHDERVDELETMVVGYFVHRFDIEPSAAVGSMAPDRRRSSIPS